jgi:hypothetical protein
MLILLHELADDLTNLSELLAWRLAIPPGNAVAAALALRASNAGALDGTLKGQATSDQSRTLPTRANSSVFSRSRTRGVFDSKGT